MYSLEHKISCNERVFLQESQKCKIQHDTNEKIGTQLLWQKLYITSFNIYCGQHPRRCRGGKEKQGKKNHCTCLRSCSLQGPKILRDLRANTLHRSTLLVLWKFALSIIMGWKSPLFSNSTESGANWDHLLPWMKMLRASSFRGKPQPWGSCLLQTLGPSASLWTWPMLQRQGSPRQS